MSHSSSELVIIQCYYSVLIHFNAGILQPQSCTNTCLSRWPHVRLCHEGIGEERDVGSTGNAAAMLIKESEAERRQEATVAPNPPGASCETASLRGARNTHLTVRYAMIPRPEPLYARKIRSYWAFLLGF